MGTNHDQTFLHILHEEKNISNFLDAFFGFLYRCTDFYVESNSEQKLGFLPGIAEKLVLTNMYKWKSVASTLQRTISVNDNTIININSITHSNQSTLADNENCRLPPVAQEIEIDSCNKSTNINPSPADSFKIDHISDCYNGAIRDNYVWTQTLSDLDVLVKIPDHIKISKDMIKIHLEKATERWWEALIVDEPKIDLSKIDCSKHFHDMVPEEQMNMQKLMWNQQQKLLGKPTSEQIKMEATLKQAWNAKGSPFQGTPYDPSILKYN
ncbi:nudC domain-containing protein 3 isoform X2 [Anoplolepis gracilipes]|uniref:nudC domain-containing protein 3 isoform X2 n=1 Tax=Anoplolepis gracilipes TaxID=354296 RepID=UPI003BA39988